MRVDSRVRSAGWFWLAAALALSTLLFGAACTRDNGPLRVPLAQLTADEGAYDGREIVTQGVVRQLQDPDGAMYDVLEDDLANRVELKPAAAAGAYVGDQVEVIGMFHFDDQQGRSMSVERVTVVHT